METYLSGSLLFWVLIFRGKMDGRLFGGGAGYCDIGVIPATSPCAVNCVLLRSAGERYTVWWLKVSRC